MGGCQLDRQTDTYPTCELFRALHRRHCQVPTDFGHHQGIGGSTEWTCGILEWDRGLGFHSLGYQKSFQWRCKGIRVPLLISFVFFIDGTLIQCPNIRDKGIRVSGTRIVDFRHLFLHHVAQYRFETTKATRASIRHWLPSLVAGVHSVCRGLGFVPWKAWIVHSAQDVFDFVLDEIRTPRPDARGATRADMLVAVQKHARSNAASRKFRVTT